MLSQKEQQEQLYIKWKNNRNYSYFVYDGILNYQKWNVSRPKIMFLLKETADDFVHIANNDIDIRNGNGSHFWWNICYWKYVVSSLYTGKDISFISTSELPESQQNYILNDIAYVNIKKQCDNKTKTNDSEILQYALGDKDLLIEQIDLINPDVIFCNPITFKAYSNIYENKLEALNEICFKYDNRLILKFRHPSYFQIAGGRETHFNDLKNAIMNLELGKKFVW